MDQGRSHSRAQGSGSTPSEESSLDLEKYSCNHFCQTSFSPPLQPHALAGQHCEGSAAYFSWPCRIKDDAEERANYFANLQKDILAETHGKLPEGQRANTLLELMTIRAFHSKILRCYSLGIAIGFRIRRGLLTDIPAILVFVSRKVHKQWLTPIQCLPSALVGPGGVWCDVDVVEFSYFGAPEPTLKEQNPGDQAQTDIKLTGLSCGDLLVDLLLPFAQRNWQQYPGSIISVFCSKKDGQDCRAVVSPWIYFYLSVVMSKGKERRVKSQSSHDEDDGSEVKKRIYVDLHIGDVIRFGLSSRLYIFQGPLDLMPTETDLKSLRKARIRQDMQDMEASLQRAKI
ncbi:hypothetical protein ACS0TY_011051 [Phlomoides rotata]